MVLPPLAYLAPLHPLALGAPDPFPFSQTGRNPREVLCPVLARVVTSPCGCREDCSLPLCCKPSETTGIRAVAALLIPALRARRFLAQCSCQCSPGAAGLGWRPSAQRGSASAVCTHVCPCVCPCSPCATTSYWCGQLRRGLLKTLRYFHLKCSQAGLLKSHLVRLYLFFWG